MRAPRKKPAARVVCVITTLPDASTARRLAGMLLERRDAACATLWPGAESHYVWKGKREKTREVALFCKTTPAVRSRLIATIRAHHPYEVPEILAWTADQAWPGYADWVHAAVGSVAPKKKPKIR